MKKKERKKKKEDEEKKKEKSRWVSLWRSNERKRKEERVKGLSLDLTTLYCRPLCSLGNYQTTTDTRFHNSKTPKTYFQFPLLITQFSENWVTKTKTQNKSKHTLLPWDPLVLSYGWWKLANPNSPLMLKLDKNSTQAVSVKNYEIRLFRSNCMQILVYLCRVSFLTTLDIYKDYFKGRHTCIEWPSALFSLKKVIASLCQRVL